MPIKDIPDEMHEEDFWQFAQQPDFGDAMVFQLTAENPENTGTFSKEGFDDITDKVQMFLTARVFSNWQQTGEPPRKMRFTVSIDWDTKPLDELSDGIPWFAGATDDIGLTQIDGEKRIPRDSKFR